MKKMFLTILFFTLALTISNHLQAQTGFNYKKYILNDSLSTLEIYVDSINKTTGEVFINGGDSPLSFKSF